MFAARGFDPKEARMSGKKKGGAANALLISIIVIAIAVFAWSGYMLIKRESEYRSARSEYDSLRDKFKGTATEAPQSQGGQSPIDFDGLLAQNPDTVGWVEIPGTKISYPIVQSGDNDKYLHTSFDGNESSSGAIFLDKSSPANLMGAHSIIYGHHMRDGSMFAQLVDFKEQAFFDEHDEILIYTPERTVRLKVIAVCVQSAGDTSVLKYDFASSQELSGFIASRMEQAVISRDADIAADADRLYSFVTCSYESDDMRTILHAVEVPA